MLPHSWPESINSERNAQNLNNCKGELQIVQAYFCNSYRLSRWLSSQTITHDNISLLAVVIQLDIMPHVKENLRRKVFLSLGSECSALKESLANEIPLFVESTKLFSLHESLLLFEKSILAPFQFKFTYSWSYMWRTILQAERNERRWQKNSISKIGKRVIFFDYRLLFI